VFYQERSKNLKGRTYKVGLYIRLSREDGDNLESESIKNQRDILNMFLERTTENLCYVDEYVDDGFTGSNFDRPSWQDLLKDIENKKIDTIITKDLSRMGRDYISMGEYIERKFPERDIRYIAINDDIDTLHETPGLEFLQFKLMFNDYYLKDTSKKIRKIVRSKKEQGKFLGWKAVYGYKKDPDDKYKLIVDEDVRHIVERIFDLALKGKSPKQIANILSIEKIPNPSAYANLNRGLKSTAFELWCPRTIEEMLVNETYIGNLTQGRRKKINYKSKKEIRTNKEDWIISENTHEPIIDKETFLIVQSLLKKGKNKPSGNNIQLLSGFMFCKECGHAIGINNSSDGKRKYCHCTYYTSHSKHKLCTPHSNNYNKLETMVLNNIREMCQQYIDTSSFQNKIEEAMIKNEVKTKLVANINIIDNKIKTNQNYIDKIYEDKLKGDIDLEMFNRLSMKYREEINKLRSQREEFEFELSNIDSEQSKKDKIEILKKINEYISIEKPNRGLLVNLIDKIFISEDKTVEIYYKFRID
jgi:DNA invertase Pin-like site-specific DNA recombinase